MNGRTLARLLRLRQIQHDVAKGQLATANETTRAAEGEYRRRAETLQSLRLPDRADAAPWLAAAASRRSAAVAVRDGAELVALARSGAESATTQWSETRAAAKGFERLEQRQKTLRYAEFLAREQREQDERSAARAALLRRELRGEDA